MTRVKLFVGVCAVAMAPTLAWAQDAGQAPSSVLELVVTAQKRSEFVKDVPLSISAFDGTTLERAGVSSARQLNFVTPGLNFQANGSTAQPAIRGISSTGSGVGDASNVATYLDGVYLPFQIGNFLDLPDIERIEVLKGPQGTLFGRNAAGGAISIVTKSPSFKPEGRGSLSYGRFNEVEAAGYVSGPLSDSVAANLSVFYHDDHGFRRDQVTRARLGAAERFVVRGKVQWNVSDATKVILGADYQRNSDISVFSGQPYFGNTVGAATPGVPIVREPNDAALSFVPILKVRGQGAFLRLESDAGPVTLTSITAFRHYESDQKPDSDVTPARISESVLHYDVDTFTQEANITSNFDGPFNFVAGVYYFNDKAFNQLAAYSGAAVALVSNVRATVKTESYAAFTEVNYDVTDRLKLIAGIRYSKDDISYVAQQLVGTPIFKNPSASFDSWTPRVSAKYELSDDLNVYATYSRGFKAGIFSYSAFSDTAVRPEKVDAYEAGLKGSLASNVQLTAAVFHYKYKDLQVQAFGATTATLFIQNAASAKIDGGEIEINASPVSGLTLRGSLAYTHGRYDSFPRAQIFVPNLDAAGRPIGNRSIVTDVSGNKLLRTPEFTANLGASYTFDDGAGGSMRVSGNAYWSDRIYYEAGNRVSQAPFTVVNASLAWTPKGGPWEVSVWAENLTNEKYVGSMLISALADNANFNKPATYGLKVEYAFGR